MLKLLLLTVVSACAFGAVVNSPHDAANLVYLEMLGSDISGKVLYSFPMIINAGDIVNTWTDEVKAPITGYFIFIDDVAGANWEHECRWVFVSPSGHLEIISMMTPPDVLPRLTIEYSSLSDLSIMRSNIIDTFVSNPRGVDAENCKALLISGGANPANNHLRYYGDIQFIYLTLTQDYGYTNDDIIICFADGLNPAPDQSGSVNSDPDLDGNGTDDFDYDATLGSVTNALSEMSTLAGAEDHVLIFTTDHGGTGGGWNCYLNLWNNEVLNDDAFDTFIDNINSASLHVVMEQSYSGAFKNEVIPTTGGQPRTFSSASRYNHLSYAGATHPYYDEWAYYWTAAMHGALPSGGALPGDPDTNSDGHISYIEAWNFAFIYDTCIVVGGSGDDPQWSDDPDSCGAIYYLGGCTETSVENSTASVPSFGLSISQNPVVSTAMVSFTLPAPAQVTVEILDITGRIVSTPVNDSVASGSHSVASGLSSTPAGLYMVRLTTGGHTETLRAVRL